MVVEILLLFSREQSYMESVVTFLQDVVPQVREDLSDCFFRCTKQLKCVSGGPEH